jgi:hypothetical protein
MPKGLKLPSKNDLFVSCQTWVSMYWHPEDDFCNCKVKCMKCTHTHFWSSMWHFWDHPEICVGTRKAHKSWHKVRLGVESDKREEEEEKVAPVRGQASSPSQYLPANHLPLRHSNNYLKSGRKERNAKANSVSAWLCVATLTHIPSDHKTCKLTWHNKLPKSELNLMNLLREDEHANDLHKRPSLFLSH